MFDLEVSFSTSIILGSSQSSQLRTKSMDNLQSILTVSVATMRCSNLSGRPESSTIGTSLFATTMFMLLRSDHSCLIQLMYVCARSTSFILAV